MDNIALFIVIGISEILALIAMSRIWAKENYPAAKRIAWTFILLVPVLGPITFALLDIPNSQDEKNNPYDWDTLPRRERDGFDDDDND
jgi:hypothetical protein